jgi:mono/diheme cytochrome c family protein
MSRIHTRGVSIVLVTLWILLCADTTRAAESSDPKLVIESGGRELTYTRAALLARPDVERIEIDDESAYARQRMRYQAVKVAPLLAPLRIPDDATLEFIATDGFTSPIPFAQLRNTSSNAAVAYLAIEDPASKWPKVRTDPTSGGPFYLVWVNPRLSNIGREEWPYRVTRIAVKESLDKLYPAILPGSDASAAVRSGHRVYAKNCLACHSLNDAGPSRLAPDLNVPMSPTEYLRPGMLRQFIRNPQSVRKYARSAMGPFPERIISETELDQLIAYMEYMARHRRPDAARSSR